ncbi:MAG: repeat protein, partial [Fibrobacteria bacterium]|nr:repeat protein [Fibrobacteria bacterium]
KPSGVITRVSNYDVGLPGNGLLVWHVNEWFLESFLPFGAVNAYLGDTLRSQYKGLELTEADGVPSIGKQFTDPLGQPAFDYGTGRDMLPHVYRKRKNPPKDTSWALPETLSVIGSYGFANTNSWNDGRTHIKLEARLPASPVFAKGVSSFSGDSVFTLRDSAITLRVYWADNNTVKQPPNSEWPVRTAAAGHPQALNLLRDGNRRAYVVSVADTGLMQTYTAAGKLALTPRDSVKDTGHYAGVTTFLSSGNTRPENAAAVNSLANPAGAGALHRGPRRLPERDLAERRARHDDRLEGQGRSAGLGRPRLRDRQRRNAPRFQRRRRRARQRGPARWQLAGDGRDRVRRDEPGDRRRPRVRIIWIPQGHRGAHPPGRPRGEPRPERRVGRRSLPR